MEKIKTLADQLREKMVKPDDQVKPAGISTPPKKEKKKADKIEESHIMKALLAYNNSDHKTMVHIRFDKRTADLMNKFKMAANVDVTKLVAFAVKHLFDTQPELKTVIKQFIENTDL